MPSEEQIQCDPIKLISFLAPISTSQLRWNTTGITVAGNPGDPLGYPFDVAVDYTYTLYIVEYYNFRVQKYLRDATNGTTVAGDVNGVSGSSANELDIPSRAIVDSDGGVYVADTGNHRIQFWANGASTGTTVAGIGKDKKRYRYMLLE